MIKVKDTTTHRIYSDTDSKTVMAETIVAEGKIVLVECSNIESPFSIETLHGFYKPILISLTEKIEIGDLYLMFIDNKWEQMERCSDQFEADRCNNNSPIKEVCFKILSLPEYFSPTTLQQIVDGELKDGDMVLVECERDTNDESYFKGLKEYKIKLNPHITLYKKEEKMYTKEELEAAYDQGALDAESISIYGYLEAGQPNFDKWFETNVK